MTHPIPLPITLPDDLRLAVIEIARSEGVDAETVIAEAVRRYVSRRFKIRREYRQFSPEEKAEHARIREQVERERPPGEARPTSDSALPATLGNYFDLRELVADLRDSRQARGLSLADVQQLSGIDPADLNRIETGENLNPSINTLARYARAVGRELRVALVERESVEADATAR